MNRTWIKAWMIVVVMGVVTAVQAQQLTNDPSQPASSPAALDQNSNPASPLSTDATQQPGLGTEQELGGSQNAGASDLQNPSGVTAPNNTANSAGDTQPQNGSLLRGDQSQPAQLGDAQPQAQNGQSRGELGIWLVETDGPGVRIRRVSEGSAAQQAGLRAGDVVMQINDQWASSPDALARLIHQMPVGQAAMLQIWRDGRPQKISAVIGQARQRAGQAMSEAGMTADRDEYEVGFRDQRGESSGDLSQRVMRLEQQLAAMTQELQQMRQQMMPSKSGAAGQPADAGLDSPLATPGAGAAQPGQPGEANLGSPTGQGQTPAGESDDLLSK